MTKRIHIISPHIDDAFLSLGGSILNWIDEGIEVYVHNIFTLSSWVNDSTKIQVSTKSDVGMISEIRKNEEVKIAEIVGFKYYFYDFIDFPLRANWTESKNRCYEEEISKRLDNIVNVNDDFIFPLGLDHRDHILIHRLSWKYLTPGTNILYYEDMPYLSWGNCNFQDLYFKFRATSTPIVQEIDFSKKMQLLTNYKSQFVQEWRQTMASYAYSVVENKYHERCWLYSNN